MSNWPKRYLPLRGSQTDVPSQQTPAHRPAQTHQQPDIAQFAEMRADSRGHVHQLGGWETPNFKGKPARTAVRVIVHTPLVTGKPFALLLPENPQRLFFFASVIAVGPAWISFGQPPGIGQGIRIQLGETWPTGFGGGFWPIDEVWTSTTGASVTLAVYEGVPTL